MRLGFLLVCFIQEFVHGGSQILGYNKPRGKSFVSLSVKKVAEVVHKTLHESPHNVTHWSLRSMAKACNVSTSSIHRIWQSHGLKPHLLKTFKLSNDPKFIDKLTDVIGLYMSPPENALVFSIDEKSQIQALDRTQPGLPMKKGRCGTMTHDYKRNGTTTLFAALDKIMALLHAGIGK